MMLVFATAMNWATKLSVAGAVEIAGRLVDWPIIR